MHPAGIILEMLGRLFALAVTQKAIECRRGHFTRPWPFIPDISPEPRGLGFTRTWGKQLDWSIIRENGLTAEHMALNGLGQRLQQGGGFADPIGEGRAVEVDALTLEYLRDWRYNGK